MIVHVTKYTVRYSVDRKSAGAQLLYTAAPGQMAGILKTNRSFQITSMQIHHKNNSLKSEVLTVQEVANFLRVSRVTVWRWCQQGTIPAFRVGRNWRIYREDLLRHLKSGHPVETPSLLP